MIKGLHGLLYSSDSDATRDFIRDKLKLPYSDVGDGWLIFDLKLGDLGVHPTEGDPPTGTHDLSFFTDDVVGTVKELKSRGVKFDGEIQDQGYGLVTYFGMPGDIRVQLYEPRYPKAGLRDDGGAKKKTAPKKGAKKAKSKAKKTAKKKRR